MNWAEWKSYSIYKKLWSIIGGRPWTWIYRDVWHKLEWFPQMQWFFTGLLIYHFFGWFGTIFFCVIYTYGYINGHFFWGKTYIENQQPLDEEVDKEMHDG